MCPFHNRHAISCRVRPYEAIYWFRHFRQMTTKLNATLPNVTGIASRLLCAGITFGIFQAINARDVDDKMAKNPASQQFLLPREMTTFPFRPATEMPAEFPPRDFTQFFTRIAPYAMLPERLHDRYFMCRRVYWRRCRKDVELFNGEFIESVSRTERNRASYSRSVQKFSLNMF